jgi:hypothetical protein
MIRPYTFEMLRAIQPFFELIAYSRLPMAVLESIISHIEKVLNRPIQEYLEQQQWSDDSEN